MHASSSCSERGLLWLHGVDFPLGWLLLRSVALSVRASAVVACGLTELLYGTRNPLGSRVEPVFPALAGGFLLIVPLGRSYISKSPEGGLQAVGLGAHCRGSIHSHTVECPEGRQILG